MKRRLSTLILVLAVVLGLAATSLAEDASEWSHVSGTSGSTTWALDEGVLTISGVGPMESYNYMHTSPWYPYRNEIHTLIISSGITTIGYNAFEGCVALTNASIPDSVRRIEGQAFLGCTSLANITLPNSVLFIGNQAFFGCTSLVSITLPGTSAEDSTIWHAKYEIGHGVFYGCTALSQVNIPDRVTAIGDWAFAYCSSLHDISIPKSVTTIGERAFYYCSSLSYIQIPDSVTTIGAAAFNECQSIKVTIIPDNLISIGYGAFHFQTMNVSSVIYVVQAGEESSASTVVELSTPAEISEDVYDYNIFNGTLPYDTVNSTVICIPGDASISANGTVVRENYIIQGYYENSDFIGGWVTEPTPGTIYYANWIPCPHENYDSGTVTVPATCTRSGQITYICQDCGAEKAEEIAPLGHDFSGAAASDGSGKHTIACVNPGCTEVSEPLDCDTNGTDGRCSVCGYKKATEPIVPAPNVPASPVMPIIKDTTGGTVTADPPSAAPGSKVTITVKPDPGYQLEDLVVTDKDGNRIECTDNGDGTYSYRQPNGGITIEARFVKVSCDGGAACPCRKFIDLDPSLWYHHEIDCVLELGLMNGVGANTFDPNGHMSRCMLMTVLARLDGQDTSTGEAWYSAGLAWAAERGISDGSAPEEAVTRQELVTMLWRYAGCPQSSAQALASFADGSEVASWAVQSMAWAVETGLVEGTDGGLLLPAATATRAQVAAILARFIA